MVRTIFAQPDAQTVHEQHRRIVDQLEQRFPEAAALLEEAAPDLLAFTALPKEHWRQLWSNNSLERLNKEIRRRTDIVGIFPDRAAIVRLVGALLAEQNDELAVASRRYMSVESIAKALTGPEPEQTGSTRAARRRLNARLRDDRREHRARRSRPDAQRAPGPTHPSTDPTPQRPKEVTPTTTRP